MSKTEALVQLANLTAKLLLKTDYEYAQLVKESYDFEYKLWLQNEESYKEDCEEEGIKREEGNFEYNYYPSLIDRLDDPYFDYLFDLLSEFKRNFKMETGLDIENETEDEFEEDLSKHLTKPSFISYNIIILGMLLY
ncbi:hypothetical protein [Metabacillus niabensis]|uniref:Uncharacterized protein n=1 Tax=Metabacillus niabensis TaxID=324854 RepID=A0ABT9Z9B2_9BACI|nr:hypothetical protein [Metabacillus niabensis]MDQ0228600.1 hypothetical protein [Metabacillus niabensis]